MQLCSNASTDHRGALEASRCWTRIGHAWEAVGFGNTEGMNSSNEGSIVHPPSLQEAKAAFAAALACIDGMGGLVAVSRVLLGQELVSHCGNSAPGIGSTPQATGHDAP